MLGLLGFHRGDALRVANSVRDARAALVQLLDDRHQLRVGIGMGPLFWFGLLLGHRGREGGEDRRRLHVPDRSGRLGRSLLVGTLRTVVLVLCGGGFLDGRDLLR